MSAFGARAPKGKNRIIETMKKVKINSIKQLTTVIDCFILFIKENPIERGDINMNLIINHNAVQPIYEQIVNSVKEKIIHGELLADTMLPSVRTLAKDLKVSALTVKKAYDQLEEEGFVVTVHGKGSFVTGANQTQILEENKKEIEAEFDRTIRKARSCGLENDEIKEMFDIILSD